MAWTDEMVEELKRLWAEGITTGEIGRRLNISKNSIVGKVHRLGLSGRPSPIKKKDDKEIVKKSAPKQKNQPKKKVETHPSEEQKTEKKKENISAKTPKPIQKEPKKVEKKTEAKPSLVAEEEADIKLAQTLNITETKDKSAGCLHLTDLDNHTCRWPIGDPKDENFHFCGKKIKMGQTYCEEHAAIAYVKPNKK